jgi:UDP-N-acetylmuramyl pentapeptide phosphotransferase/UDP-N-acetylglucosamine-1-phosphate transferase
VAILLGVYIPALVYGWWTLHPLPGGAWLAGSGLLVAGVSFLDDRASLAPGYRALAHLAAALALCWGAGVVVDRLDWPGGSWALPPLLPSAITVVFLMWALNLYNFMDGMDGLAGGMAVIGFGTYAILGFLANDASFMTLSLIISGAAAGFLLHNFPPAQMFMGDTGSALLGLLAGSLTVLGAQRDVFPLWCGLLVFSVFIVDATVTLSRRLFRGQLPWIAHKTHYYQRLVGLGWTQRQVLLRGYALMLGCSLSAIALLRAPAALQWLALCAWAGIFVLVAGAIHRLEHQRGRET